MQFYDAPPPANQNQPIEPHTIVSGILPGATQIRIGGDSNVLIDGLNRRVTITQADGSSVGIGIIPNTGELGSFTLDTSGNLVSKVVSGIYYFYDTSGNLLQKIAAGTTFYYDTTGRNDMQIGTLPDGTHNLAIAKAGFSISDAITP